jgi:hypothetical protein
LSSHHWHTLSRHGVAGLLSSPWRERVEYSFIV